MDDKARELAFRYDLFIASDWSERFDELVSKHLNVPNKGRFLEVNCGTGSWAIAVALQLKDGEVVGVDASPERVALAQAKAQMANAERCSFVEGNAEGLAFEDDSLDLVVADSSLAPPSKLHSIASEAVRVARQGAPVAVKVSLRGSFDEFFSLYWEALFELGLADEVWGSLEALITARPTLEEAIKAVRSAGIAGIRPHQRKEEFRFDTAAEFLESPLVADLFLDEWLSIVPAERREEVRGALERIIDRERGNYYFNFSAKALVACGHKPV
jgi:ubiquinone/menaquinone biosynthesis C-methylase UbiE